MSSTVLLSMWRMPSQGGMSPEDCRSTTIMGKKPGEANLTLAILIGKNYNNCAARNNFLFICAEVPSLALMRLHGFEYSSLDPHVAL
ncbi:hypothetical protein E4U22_007152 [Claviceps purpurea]|nr:hypothetical protein E4U36_007112 [Claviceps purpurea]KAG6316318.1 hypothetical protein E4U22_007152 [Claviceps purpurea]